MFGEGEIVLGCGWGGGGAYAFAVEMGEAVAGVEAGRGAFEGLFKKSDAVYLIGVGAGNVGESAAKKVAALRIAVRMSAAEVLERIVGRLGNAIGCEVRQGMRWEIRFEIVGNGVAIKQACGLPAVRAAEGQGIFEICYAVGANAAVSSLAFEAHLAEIILGVAVEHSLGAHEASPCLGLVNA